MNKIFVVEGTDGSGKETQVSLLEKRLVSLGYKVFRTSFPCYENLSSGPVREYLSGSISDDPDDVSSKAASLFFAVDRYIQFREKIQKYYVDDETIILLDRYTTANLVHQGGKILSKNLENIELDRFQEWLFNLEFGDLELPKPTQVFFLQLPYEYSANSMKDRTNKFTKEEKKDIHESNSKHLISAEQAGMYYAKKLSWHIVNCLEEDGINRRTVEDINDEILNNVIYTL